MVPIDIQISWQLAWTHVHRQLPYFGLADDPSPLQEMLSRGMLTNALMIGLGVPAAIGRLRNESAKQN
jgi:hypothetical protein